ncbi:chloride channel protein [Enterococcus dongliensis]|uniref:Chloride channel protein n=1 Tax=Enterococcus dongliensis TaxID=2559925 RepID=A0AAW8TLY2_9ENTE|nr:chloride channel protein [Enterococcus dongliensis]MDT2597289.1 chloride channel protein [Enterococcus dongliensis]MDT2604433.1 chloride channel protein [Enterococcus dongliensis]MDT2635158.1 chloride channel protein [Enterococcus dongliensis]MDT2637838.1 chloride channel protein [Enterococcus dongliensis]MDT2643518.1 chloride channel protein [Enterococcus dongliensis]
MKEKYQLSYQNSRKAWKDLILLYFLILLVSVLTGVISHYLLAALHFVTAYRQRHYYLLFYLPLIGMVSAFVYQKFGRGAQKGNNLIIESLENEAIVPGRMAVFTFIFTILSHLFGASVGREGSAVQIGGVFANKMADFFHLEKNNRKWLIHAGISAGFSSIFGTPLAGSFFGMEMAFVGNLERAAMIPCFLSAYLANYISKLLGTTHDIHDMGSLPVFSIKLVLLVILAAILFGIFGHFFALLTHSLKQIYTSIFKNYLLRAFITSVIVVIVLWLTKGQRFMGLSLPLIDDAFVGKTTFLDPIVKLVTTALSLAAGLQGGEVTPLFAIGSSLGSSLGNLFGVSPAFLAALGLIAVFGCAANAPLTTIMLGIDLFDVKALPYFIITSFVSYFVSGHQGIYTSQTIIHAKSIFLKHHEGYQIGTIKEATKNKK